MCGSGCTILRLHHQYQDPAAGGDSMMISEDLPAGVRSGVIRGQSVSEPHTSVGVWDSELELAGEMKW